MLKDAEKRGEVINIDSDEESAQGKENKRRKVSLSPQANNNNNAASIGQLVHLQMTLIKS